LKAFFGSPRFRLGVRVLALAAFLLLSLAGVLPAWLGGGGGGEGSFAPLKEPSPSFLTSVLPSLSPFAVLSSALAQRSVLPWLCLALSGAVLAIAIVFRGRFFCGWICPMGTLMELQARLFGKGLLKSFPRFGGLVFWIAVSGAALGLPVLLWMDPLASFNRLTVFLRWPFPFAFLVPASLAVLALAIGFLKPMAWCVSVCPLGYALSLPGRLGALRGASQRDESVSELRRDFLKGVCAGVPLSLAASYVPGALAGAAGSRSLPVLPPGAVELKKFHASCTRCYACVNACPAKVIVVELPKNADIESWFAPRLNADKSSCWEHCNRCSSVCAPGAIRPISLEAKSHLQIGVASVERSRCLAWSKGQHCMVCQEFCPYNAIKIDEDANGIPRPVILKDACRGCGFCQMSCPVRPPAVKVEGVERQRTLS